MTAIRLLLTLTFVTIAISGSAQSVVDWSTVVEKASPAVVTVLAENSEARASGTGFFITPNGWVVTNYHVIKGMRTIRIRTHNGSVYAIKGVLAVDSDRDLVLLDAGVRAPAVLETAFFSAGVKSGQPVCVIGSPLNLDGTVSTGVVSALREMDGKRVVQITAPISPGSSGSPVLNAAGKVIGVATMTVKDGQNLNMAVSSDYILNMMIVAVPRQAQSQTQKKIVSVTPRDDLSKHVGDAPVVEIELTEGTYHIDDLLMVTKPLVLRGAGADKTRIVSSYGPVIGVPVNANVLISDVSLEYIGNNQNTIVAWAAAGQVTFYRCRIKGGGIGLVVRGTASATLDSCTVEKNPGMGVVLGERAQATIRDTVFTQNGLNGIYITQDASATLTNAICRQNGRNGVEVDEYAQVVLRNSLLEDNRVSGIALWGNSVADIQNNVCRNHAKYGIYAGQAAQLVAKGNVCEDNRGESGIGLWGNSVADIQNNVCRNNAKYGIYADQAAQLVAKGNVCEGNGWGGIALFGEAVANLQGNTCRNNQTGIYIETTAKATLQNNNCNGNRSDVVDRRR